MNKKDRVKLEILSNIDENIIEEVTKKRIKLSRNLQKVGFWRRKWVPITAIAAALAMVGGIFLAILLLGKQVPVYTGMTVSNQSPFEVAYVGDAQYEQLAATGHFEGDHVHEPPKPPKKPALESVVEDSLQVEGAAQTLYYANPKEDIYITVHIDNPDQYEILSFTLNGKKYSSYMFEEGSDMENLVLKVNVGDVEGLVEYTIDAIKYVDGTQIKDVKMEGDQTVRVGVKPQKEVSIKIENETVDYDSISFAVSVADQHKLIEGCAGKLQAALYLENELVATKDLSLTEPTEVVFDLLHPNTAYQYAIVAHYDPLDSKGFGTHILYQNEVYTQAGLLFGDINITQTELSFALTWHEAMAQKTLNTLTLYRGEEKVKELSFDTSKLSDLLSGVEYTLVAEYTLNGKTEQSVLTFTTEKKVVPTVNFENIVRNCDLTAMKTSIQADVVLVDPYQVATIKSISLYHDEKVVSDSDIFTTVRFENLDLTIEYTLRVVYAYDLNDGNGVHVEIANLSTWENSEGLEIKDGEITGIGSCNDQVVFFNLPIAASAFKKNNTILNVFCGKRVTSIGEYAFAQCKSLTSCYLPEGLSTIAAKTFVTCESLAIINVPNSVISIGDYAIQGCTGLTDITIPNSVTNIGIGAFNACKNLTSITIPDSVTNIGNNAFYACHGLTSITIGKGATHIGERVFGRCTSLTNIHIPTGITSIDKTAFLECSSLATITVETGNPVYHSNQNCLIETKSKTLIVGCKNSVIPNDGSVTSIGEGAFYGCASFINITIPNSIINIDSGSFFDCNALGRIYYNGTEAEWDSVTIGDGNDSLTAATVYYYSETEPTDASGNYWHYVNGEPTLW